MEPLVWEFRDWGQMDGRERVKSCSTFPFFGCFDNVRRLRDTGGRPRVAVTCSAKRLPSKPTVLVRRHCIANFSFLHSQMCVKRFSIQYLASTFEQNSYSLLSCCMDFWSCICISVNYFCHYYYYYYYYYYYSKILYTLNCSGMTSEFLIVTMFFIVDL
jgi:hypothetical protein